MFRIEVKAIKHGRGGAFTGTHGLPTDGIFWELHSVPELPVPYPHYEKDYKEQLRIAKSVCKKVGGWIFVINEQGETLLVQEWKDGGDIEPELAGFICLIEHEPADFRF